MDNKQIINFLQRKGALELLVEIGHSPKRHTDLRETLLLSSSTIHKRLTAGVQVGLWRQSLEQQPSGVSAKVYELTDIGQKVWAAAHNEELRQHYRARRKTARQVQHMESAVLQEVSTQDAE
jgi:DNA-binding MarR family transcriptional regulator